MDMGKKGLYMIQSLVFAYIATGILLCLIAFIIYQSNAGMKKIGRASCRERV